MDVLTYALSKKYTADTADSLGSLKGAPATVKSITPIDGGNRVTFSWTGTSGTEQTMTMDVMHGAQGIQGNPGEKGEKGDDGAKGDRGDDGYSPTVTVAEITGGHRVTVTDAEGSQSFDVMDGQGGQADSIDWSKVTNKPSDLVQDSAYVHTDSNFTGAEKTKLAGLSNYDDTALKGRVSATETAIAAVETGKVDKVAGKDLSTNDYTNAEKAEVAKVADKADKAYVDAADTAIETEIAAVANRGAKNLFPNKRQGTTLTTNGVTFTVNADGSVTLNGRNTATAENQCYIQLAAATDATIKAGSYYLSGVPEGYANKLWVWGSGFGENRTESDRLITITEDKSVSWGVTVAVGDTQLDNVTVYPMLRDAAITDDTYEPYAMSNAELTNKTAKNGGGALNLARFDGDIAFGKYLSNSKRGGFMIGIDGLSTDNDEGYTHDRIVFSRTSTQKQIIHQCFDPATNQFVREAVYTADEDTGWLTATLNTSVWTGGSLNYRKKNGIVFLTMNGGKPAADIAAGNSITIATLPAGFRPTGASQYGALWLRTASGSVTGEFLVSVDGRVFFRPQAAVTAANITNSYGTLSFPV